MTFFSLNTSKIHESAVRAGSTKIAEKTASPLLFTRKKFLTQLYQEPIYYLAKEDVFDTAFFGLHIAYAILHIAPAVLHIAGSDLHIAMAKSMHIADIIEGLLRLDGTISD